MAKKISQLSLLAKRYKPKKAQPYLHVQPGKDFGQQSLEFREAAERLAKTFTGAPMDDTLLMPYLLLCRHAFELELKDLLLQTAANRRRVAMATAEDTEESVQRRMKEDYRHNLLKLYTSALQEFKVLAPGLEDPPKSLSKLVNDLHQMDSSGENFRYPDQELDQSFTIDFLELHRDMTAGFKWLGALGDYYLDAISHIPDAKN